MFEFMKLAPKLGELLKAGVRYHDSMVEAGQTPDVEQVAMVIEAMSADWNPTIKGITVLDDPGTRKAGARFLAGVATRVAAAGMKVAA